jgi:TonB family protein
MQNRAFLLIAIVLVCGGLIHAQRGHDGLPVSQCPPERPHILARTLQANLAYRVAPEYPETAIAAKIEGDVALKIVIDEQGNVINAEVRKGHQLLAAAALKSIKEWKYKPAFVGGHTTESEGLVLLTFRLDDNPRVQDGGPPELLDLLDVTLGLGPQCLDATGPPAYKLLRWVEPEYPQAAKAAHIQGDVVIRIFIDKNGDITTAIVVRGHPLLAAAALKAVWQWKYAPIVLDQGSVAVQSMVTVRFHM